jgi:hypothetical protein
LIQKTQISVFGKYLNLFEFKNTFDLNLNLGFKFKFAEKKLEKLFYFSLASPTQFGPNLPFGPNLFL